MASPALTFTALAILPIYSKCTHTHPTVKLSNAVLMLAKNAAREQKLGLCPEIPSLTSSGNLAAGGCRRATLQVKTWIDQENCVAIANICGKLRPCTTSGYQTILPLFQWPGNETSTTPATEHTPFPSSETNFSVTATAAGHVETLWLLARNYDSCWVCVN